jgi:hypothetical protein
MEGLKDEFVILRTGRPLLVRIYRYKWLRIIRGLTKMQTRSFRQSPEQQQGSEDNRGLVNDESCSIAKFRNDVYEANSGSAYREAYESMRRKMDFNGNGALNNLELEVGLGTNCISSSLTDLERRLGATLISNTNTVDYICPGFCEKGLTSADAGFLSVLKQHGPSGVFSTKMAVYSSTFGAFGLIGGLGAAMLTGVGRTGALTQAGVGFAIGIAASAGLAYHEYTARKSGLEKLLKELP